MYKNAKKCFEKKLTDHCRVYNEVKYIFILLQFAMPIFCTGY